MGNMLDIGEAIKFSGALKNTTTALETSNENIQLAFVNSYETFRKMAYEEFKEEYNAADRTIGYYMPFLDDNCKNCCERVIDDCEKYLDQIKSYDDLARQIEKKAKQQLKIKQRF